MGNRVESSSSKRVAYCAETHTVCVLGVIVSLEGPPRVVHSPHTRLCHQLLFNVVKAAPVIVDRVDNTISPVRALRTDMENATARKLLILQNSVSTTHIVWVRYSWCINRNWATV
jgi:hypothetical protein